MPTPVTGQTIWLYTIFAELNGQTILNTMHYQRVGTVATTDYQALADNFLSWQQGTATSLFNQLKNATTVDVLYKELWFQPVYLDRFTKRVVVVTPDTGVLASPAAPANVAATITKTTVVARRWGRGSMHIAGSPAASAVASSWSATHMGRLADIAAAIVTPAGITGGGNGFNPVLWSRNDPTRVTVVEEAFPQSTVRVERRRTVRVGI